MTEVALDDTVHANVFACPAKCSMLIAAGRYNGHPKRRICMLSVLHVQRSAAVI